MSKSQYRKRKTTPPRRLRWLWISGGLLAVIGLAVYALASREPPFTPEVTGEPRAQVEQTAIDHGTLQFETWVTSVFNIRNTGDQPLLILGEPLVEVVEGC
jgi:hypothetical protein